jgi:hypothetical protein
VQITPHGHSMEPRVKNGAKVTLVPITDPENIKVDDIVLVSVRGRSLLHLVKARRGSQYMIGNNKGGVNGWVGPKALYGLATEINND